MYNPDSTLPQYTNQEDAKTALQRWEASNPDQCSRQRDNGQFFGFKEVGEARLERFTQFLLVPAVRDAAEDAAEGRGRVISEIMDLVVRNVLAQKEEVKQLTAETQRRYEQIMDPSEFPELRTLAEKLTLTLQTYVPGASVDLAWLALENINIPLPKADVKLVENDYASAVSRSGHGLQRAFILTMLQHLAVAQPPTIADQAETESAETHLAPQTPNLILAIEEPELYQHPNRQRYMSAIFLKLAMGSIAGVAERTQLLYSTHSPLFVDVPRTDQVRVLRRVPAEGGRPRQTKVFHTTLDAVARILEKISDVPEGTYSGGALRPRLQAVMTPWMNEGFFADVVVLVEGEEDRAAILGIAAAKGHDLEGMGISVIPCGGKNSLDRPVVIFKTLGISVYVIWDGDFGKSGEEERQAKMSNHRLLKLFEQAPVDWPEMVEDTFACFKKNMTTTLREEIGQSLYDQALQQICEILNLEPDHAKKNAVVIQQVIEEANKQGQLSKTLSDVLDRVIKLKQ